MTNTEMQNLKMNNLTNAANNTLMDSYKNTGNITSDIGEIILSAQKTAYKTVDTILVRRNWLIGRRIAEEELAGKDRADYGVEVIKKLSKELTNQYGKGFAKTNLYSYYLFYKTYPEIFHTVCGKSELLSWSHYRLLIYVDDSKAREWYQNEACPRIWLRGLSLASVT